MFSIDIPQILVFNKSDLLKKTGFEVMNNQNIVYISSTTQFGFKNLKLKIHSALYGSMYKGWIKIPYKYSFIKYKLEELGIISKEKNLKNSLKIYISIHEDHLLPLINKDYVQRV
jgi:50S ribosomal subunit-associated GTPase HflX